MGSFKDTLKLPQTAMPIAADLPNREPAVYASWGNVYARMKRDGKDSFVLHDGPPYANGDIHIGHALNKILKDFIVKFQYFSGRAVEFVPGWDCHGLPIEQQVQKIIRMGGGSMPEFKDPEVIKSMCRTYAGEQIAKQKEQFKALGVLADWDNHYETMSAWFENMIVDSLSTLIMNGYLSRRRKPVYWSWAYQTALAEAEVEYQERTDNSIYLVFKTDKFPWGLLVWTTTPWTLPANVAVALNPELQYVAVHVKGYELPVLVAAELVPSLTDKGIVLDVVKDYTAPGKEFDGWRFQHPVYPDQTVPCVMADFVSAKSGTGCVHIAPGHGVDDYLVALKYALPVVMPVGPDGRYTEGKYLGQWIFEDDSNKSLKAKKDGTYKENSYNSNPVILADLAEAGLLVHTEKITHSYPYCSRSGTPVIFRATEQWFLNLDKIRAAGLFDAVKQTEFFPENSRNRMMPMLEGRPDWCVSRQRLWGVPIQDGPDILDVWFDSGLSWNILGKQADVYLEGNDQHRGWFQSSLWLSVALTGQAPYKKVITHGFVVDQEGRKMSKSKGNVVSPLDVTKKLGAEVLRYWVASIDYTKEAQCSDEILKRAAEGYKKLRNTFRFLVANMPAETPPLVEHILPVDRWIYSTSQKVFAEVRQLFGENLFYAGMQKLTEYVNNDLSGVYMAAAKDRLYCSVGPVRDSAVVVMADILRAMTQLVAPLFTYTAQEVFSHCPKWVFGEDKRDVFDLVYVPLQPMPQTYFDDFGWLTARDAFNAEFDKIKAKGLVRDPLEVVIEKFQYPEFFEGAADWFGVSACNQVTNEEFHDRDDDHPPGYVFGSVPVKQELGSFTVDYGDDVFGERVALYRILKSSQPKCERCWKRTALGNLCPRCMKVVG